MYRIYADGILIHDLQLDDDTRMVRDPNLILEINSSGNLTFIMPPKHIAYNSLHKMTTIITVSDGSRNIFRGRVISDERDFNNEKSVTCEGMYAFFLDSIVRPHTKTMLLADYITWLINNHNSQVESAKQFFPGKITVNDTWASLKFTSEDYITTADTLIELADTYDGYFTTRELDGHSYLDFLSDSNTDSAQTIEFGQNLLDIKKTLSAEATCTVLIPIGGIPDNSEDDKNITIKPVNNNVDYIELASSVSAYGRIVQYKEWSDITDPAKLLTAAQDYLRSCAGLDVSLEVSAVDLSLVYANYESINIGERVHIISKPHDIDEFFTCVKIEMDLIDPSNTIYNFGTMNTKLLSEKVTKVSDSSKQSVNNLNTKVENNFNKSTYIYVHQDELNDAINRLSNEDIDSICAS